MKHIIWSNMNLDLDDWKDFLDEEYPEITDEHEQYHLIEDMNMEYLEDERCNLSKNVDGRILVIADLGLWDGRRQGYKILGDNISSILYGRDTEYIEWYGDGYNIKAAAHHHDGCNLYLYRIIRENRNINNLLSDIYNGKKITRQKINYYTKSLYPEVAKIYGWK